MRASFAFYDYDTAQPNEQCQRQLQAGDQVAQQRRTANPATSPYDIGAGEQASGNQADSAQPEHDRQRNQP